MKLVVCIKHVPDPDGERNIVDGALVREEDDLMNELDEHAIQAAVDVLNARALEPKQNPDEQNNDEQNNSEENQLIAITMGPEDAEESLLNALQRGADRAVLINDDRLAGSDVVGTALVLAQAVHKIEQEDGQPVDIVFTSVAAADSMTGMLPAALAQALDLPCLSAAGDLELLGDKLRVNRWVDGRQQVLSALLPAVVSVTDQVSEPMYPNFQAITAANAKPLDTWDLDDLEFSDQSILDRLGLGGARSEVVSARLLPSSRGAQVMPAGQSAVERMAQLLNDNIA